MSTIDTTTRHVPASPALRSSPRQVPAGPSRSPSTPAVASRRVSQPPQSPLSPSTRSRRTATSADQATTTTRHVIPTVASETEARVTQPPVTSPHGRANTVPSSLMDHKEQKPGRTMAQEENKVHPGTQHRRVESGIPAPTDGAENDGPRYIQPAEFFPLNNGAGGKYVAPYSAQQTGQRWLSPEDDPEAKRGIPVFRPTMEEFQDFEGYVTKTVPWGQYSGIAKIIPPDEWNNALPPITNRTLNDVRIKSPIQQTMLGRKGLFRVTNVEKRKQHPLDVHEWFDMCQSKKFVGPGPKDADRTLDRDSKEAKERRERTQAEMKAKKLERREKLAAARKRKEARLAGQQALQISQEADDVKKEVPNGQPVENSSGFDGALDGEAVPELAHSPHSSSSSDPVAVTPNPDAVDPFYKSFDPKTAWLPEGTTQDDYTAEACAVMERKFWKTLLTREPSWYGADLQGSLFVDKQTPWNVSCLPNLLNRCSLTKKLPGVNSPYLYFGMYGATFAWHVEDMDLFSINYIHFGAPKFWYAVPQRHSERFENTLAGYFPQDAQRCDQFLRHKSFTMSASQLANDKIPVNMLVHKQNEFVITYPRGYHAGFNMGFNCAESINFALESWLELGRRAKVCECVEHSVRINVDEMLAERELVEAIEQERKTGRPRKRKTLDSEHPETPAKVATTPRPRKIKIIRQDQSGMHVDEEEEDEDDTTRSSLPVNGMETKKKKVRLTKDPKLVIVKEIPSYPCLFCPSLSTDHLRPVLDPTDAVRAYSQSRDEKLMAHHACALGIPEVGIEDIDVDGSPVQHIVNTDRIETARWKLKCQCCHDKKLKASGAKVQCVKKSCIKAFHVSCAMNDPRILYNVYEVFENPPTLTEPGLEGDGVSVSQPSPVRRLDVQLLCELHNPAQIEQRKQEAIEELKTKILALSPGSEIKVKSRGGGQMIGTFRRAIPENAQVEVEFDGGQKFWVPFDRVDFKETKHKVVVENGYARQYNTKAKEPIPSRSVPVPARAPLPVPKKELAPARPRPSHPPAPTGAPAPMPMQHAPHSRYPYAPPPQHVGYLPVPHQQHPWQDPRIPTRVVNGFAPHPHPHSHPVYYRPHAGYPQTAVPASYQAANPYHHQASPSGSWQVPQNTMNQMTNGHSQQPSRPAQPPAHDRSDKIDLSLQHMRTLMSLLPPMRTPAIHLAGTNGKGSVSAILETALRVSGLRVGRYNSPHLVEPRDAIRIDGQSPSREAYEQAMCTVKTEAERHSISVSPFELGTAVAYYLFTTANPPLDVMVIECGMGGVNDATNVIPANCTIASALTSVGLDHTNFLGNSIAGITEQKAGITVPGGLLFTSPNLPGEALRVVHHVAYQRSAAVIEASASTPLEVSDQPQSLSLKPFVEPAPTTVRTRLPMIMDGRMVPGEEWIGTRLSLGGAHQLDNLSLAVTILHVISKDKRALSIQPALARITMPAIQRGVEITKWEGRCSWLRYLSPGSEYSLPLLVDGAHNIDSATTLRAFIDSLGVQSGVHFIISLSSSPGKSPESVLRPLLRPDDEVTIMDFTTPVEGMPWVKPAIKTEVADAIRTMGSIEVDVQEIPGVEGLKRVLDQAAERFSAESVPRLTVICGSLYLVADVYRLLRS